jgi:trigger factor
MKAVAEPLEGNKVKLSVEVDEAEFEKAVDAAFRRLAQEVKVDGFRPGKAPRRVLEAKLGPGVAREEAMRAALPGYYENALRETDTDAIAQPEIDITAGQDTGPLAFDAVVEVRPVISVPGYDALKVVVPNPEPSAEDVDAQIDRLRNQGAELTFTARKGTKSFPASRRRTSPTKSEPGILSKASTITSRAPRRATSSRLRPRYRVMKEPSTSRSSSRT